MFKTSRLTKFLESWTFSLKLKDPNQEKSHSESTLKEAIKSKIVRSTMDEWTKREEMCRTQFLTVSESDATAVIRVTEDFRDRNSRNGSDLYFNMLGN